MDPASLSSAGWTLLAPGDFSATVGPFWTRGEGEAREVGFIAEPRHGNGRSVHGGALMTFADVAFGSAVALTLGGPYCVTLQLQMQFVAPGPLGAFIHCRPEIVRRSAQLLFLRGLIRAGERTVASADGIWTVLDRLKPA